jgi:hypothetical protein
MSIVENDDDTGRSPILDLGVRNREQASQLSKLDE